MNEITYQAPVEDNLILEEKNLHQMCLSVLDDEIIRSIKGYMYIWPNLYTLP